MVKIIINDRGMSTLSCRCSCQTCRAKEYCRQPTRAQVPRRFGHLLGHDAVGTVGKLLNAPQLLGCACEFGHCYNLGIGSSGQCAVGAFDHDLIVGTSEVASAREQR